MATPDGFPLKTNKAMLMHEITNQNCLVLDFSKDDITACIVDRMAFYHNITNIPKTFGDLTLKFLNSLPQTKNVHFVADTYRMNSTKTIERDSRGRSDNSILLTGPAMKIPSNWKGFVLIDENKKTLTSF